MLALTKSGCFLALENGVSVHPTRANVVDMKKPDCLATAGLSIVFARYL
jgi:hypothetical protein